MKTLKSDKCHRPDRNCALCHTGGLLEMKLSKDESKELNSRKREGTRIHCGDCGDLITDSNKTPVNCFGNYCKRYKKELEYYDGSLKLDVCFNKRYGEKK